MSINFPGSLDTSTQLPQPSASDFTNSPSHAGAHDNLSLATIAIETKLGTGASTATNNNLLIGTGSGSSAWTKAAPSGTIVGTTDSQTLTNKTLTSPTINTAIISNPTLTVDTISGFTTSTVGTAYGLGINNGSITPTTITASGLLTASNGFTLSSGTLTLPNAVIKPSMLATGASSAFVATSESTASTSYTQLTTTTDQVTVIIGANGVALVVISATLSNATSGDNAFMSFAVSGATTTAANDNMSIQSLSPTGTQIFGLGGTFLVTGLSSGSTTFKAEYRVPNGTGSWLNRRIGVVPL